MSAGRGSKATPDTLKTKKPTSSPIKGRQNLHNTSSMTALKHLKPLFWIAIIASICVTPIALMFAYSPFHDVNDFFNLACVITLRVPKNVPT
jgi:putative membrane protein